MRYSPLALALVVAVSAWGCGSGSATSPAAPSQSPAVTAAAAIQIVGGEDAFSPDSAEVRQGGLVYWFNGDSVTHDVVMDDGSFDSGTLASGSSSDRIVASSGSYHCSLHPGEVATISVQAN